MVFAIIFTSEVKCGISTVVVCILPKDEIRVRFPYPAPKMQVLEQANAVTPWYVTDVLLPLVITFVTFIFSQLLFRPVKEWWDIKKVLIIYTTQYANYVAYSHTNPRGKRILEDRGLMHIVEQALRCEAGRIEAL